ncbi:MAG: lipase maturation factor family protein [Candidatus Margulisiibacteriota bacterium]
MQKLLVLTRHSFLTFFTSYLKDTSIVTLYLRLLAIVLTINFTSLIFQFSDLALLDVPVNLNTVPLSLKWLNIFSYISYDYSLYVLVACLILSILIFFLVFPFWALLFIAFLYSALIFRFPTFLSFQWDILLIEVCFFSLFFISPKYFRYTKDIKYSFISFLPLMLLIIRLFVHSGLVKLLSNDIYWLGLSALDIHLYSQPMPHFLSFFIHYWLIKLNLGSFFVYLVFLFELVLPFGLLIPTYRKITAGLLIFFQLCILLTGNFGFFNFLVIVPLILFYRLSFDYDDDIQKYNFRFSFKTIAVGIVLCVILINSSFKLFLFKSPVPIMSSTFNSMMLFKSYGLFARMTTKKTKFNVFVSNDLNQWFPIELNYFDPQGYPTLELVQPYMPRIRWQLWFKFLMPNDALPSWYLSLIKYIASNDFALNSIVKSKPSNNSYQYVKLCYQSIVFNLNKETRFRYPWMDQSFSTCDIFDTKKISF